MRLFNIYIMFYFLPLVSCINQGNHELGSMEMFRTFTIHIEEEYQTIHNFGASDAWSVQFVGENWPVDKRELMADLLFSTEFDSHGNPKGIGLSLWRFNIGAGSARQGDESGIADSWRRSESFLSADSTYDWGKQQGQQWFMRAAKERGVEQFTGFVNSPPIMLTKTGKAFGDGGSDANIVSSNYNKFADYLARIAQHFKNQGIPLTYISPVNEPQWDWAEGNGQEGSPYKNEEMAGVVKALDAKILEYGLDIKIEVPETAQIDFLYGGNLPGRNNQTEFFFGSESSVRELPSLAPKMAAHSYFTTYPLEDMVEQRRLIRENIKQMDSELEYWMSEFCVLGNVGEGMQGNGRDLGIDPALYVARVMHYDLTIANASSWQWWLGISPYNYKDGLLYIDHDKNDGNIYESKILWAVGNFSRFIRPGAIRIAVSRSDGLTPVEAGEDVMVSAFYHEKDQQMTTIAVNYSEESHDIEIMMNENNAVLSGFTAYITSADTDLKKQATLEPGQMVTIPARSVVTLISNLE